MRHRALTPRGGRRGEIIWVLPLLVLFVTAIIHFGLVLRMQVRLTEAARAGAVFGSKAPGDDQLIVQEIKPVLPFWLNQDHLTITIRPPPASRTGGSAIHVHLELPTKSIRGVFPVGRLIGIPDVLTGDCVVPVVEAGGRPTS